MLHLLDHSLQAYLRAAVPLPDDVEVSFETPDREWVAKLAQPTVNLFLYDVRPDRASRRAGWEVEHRADGVWRERPAPRATCRYLVTAWANDPDDEHRLLGALLRLLLHPRRLPREHLAAGLAGSDHLPVLTTGFDEPQSNIADMWSALGGQLRPGVDLKVDLDLDAIPVTVGPLGAPVARTETTTRQRLPGGPAEHRTRVGGHTEDVDGQVRSVRGSAPVAQGRFLVHAEPGDLLILHPEESTVVVGDEGPADFSDPAAAHADSDHSDRDEP